MRSDRLLDCEMISPKQRADKMGISRSAVAKMYSTPGGKAEAGRPRPKATMIAKDQDISYANCGLLYYVSGMIESREAEQNPKNNPSTDND